MRIDADKLWVRFRQWRAKRKISKAQRRYGKVTVRVRQGGHSHFVRGVEISGEIEVRIPIAHGGHYQKTNILGTVGEGSEVEMTPEERAGATGVPWPQEDVEALREQLKNGLHDGWGRRIT